MRPTARQVHAYAQCPHCATALRGGTVKRSREVIEHVDVERRCPRCRGRWLPAPGLDGVVIGQGRRGVGLLRLITVLREELRLPIERIQWCLGAVHGLPLSVGAIVGTLHTVAARAAPRVAQMQETIRGSPVLHADETGWREDGHNGYVWTFWYADRTSLHAREAGARRARSDGRDGLRRGAGQRFRRRLHQLRRPPPLLLGALAA